LFLAAVSSRRYHRWSGALVRWKSSPVPMTEGETAGRYSYATGRCPTESSTCWSTPSLAASPQRRIGELIKVGLRRRLDVEYLLGEDLPTLAGND
jgi:hypothetical protein